MEEERQVTKFNSMQLQIMRLGKLWDKSHQYAQSEDLLNWMSVLKRIWIELGADANPKEIKIFKNFVKLGKGVADKKIGLIPYWEVGCEVRIDDAKRKGINIRQIARKNKEDMMELLFSLELFLRKVEKAQGKGAAYMNEDDEIY